METDVVYLAMLQAARDFGGNDGMFNGAKFSKAINRIANLNGTMDGLMVQTLLTGRRDVEHLGGGHYRVVVCEQAQDLGRRR